MAERCLIYLYLLKGDFNIPDSALLLDFNLLEKLPEDIVCHVLHQLPYSSKIRFSVVCEEWRSELSSLTHLRRNAASALPSPSPQLCVLSMISEAEEEQEVELGHYKHYELGGLNSILPDIEQGVFFVQEGILGYMFEYNFDDEEPTSFSIRLVNLMTRSWRDLPSLTLTNSNKKVGDFRMNCSVWYLATKIQAWRVKIHVHYISEDGTKFDLLFAPPDFDDEVVGCDTIFQIHKYCSQTNEWSITDLQAVGVRNLTFCAGVGYIVNSHDWREPLRRFSLENGKFLGELYCDMPPCTCHVRLKDCYSRGNWDYVTRFTEYQGELFCVAEIPISIDGPPSAGIWKLNKSKGKFEEYTRMPIDVYQVFLSRVYKYPTSKMYVLHEVKTVGDYICITIIEHDLDFGYHNSYHLLVCHMSTKKWYIELTNLNYESSDERAFDVFHPRLDIFL